MQLVFDARREQVRVRLIQLEREKAALEKTIPKPPEPAKLDPPDVRLAGAVTHRDHSFLVFEVVNSNAAPVPYLGYIADSFEPKLPEGGIYPLHKIEFRVGKEWKEEEIGWCGTGIGPVSITNKQKGQFEIPIPKGVGGKRSGSGWSGSRAVRTKTHRSHGASRLPRRMRSRSGESAKRDRPLNHHTVAHSVW